MRHQVTARVPDATYVQLKALSAFMRVSQADVIARSLAALEGSLTAAERKVVQMLKEREGR